MKACLSIILYCLLNFYLSAYQGDDEVTALFSRLEDPKQPKLEEYKMIEEFLRFGKRPYLEPIGAKGSVNKRNGRDIKLVGDKNEMPIHECYSFNVPLNNKKRCIIIYSSYNYPYPGKAEVLLKQLKQCGYKGHFIFRIGGYPHLSQGGIALCHIPYSWKLASLLEARSQGYQYILWLDLAIHPLCDLESIFNMIEKDHYLCTAAGFNLDYPYNLGQHLPNAIQALGLTIEQLQNIPHISSQLIGLDMAQTYINDFLDDWLQETLKVEPCMNWYPEELCYSVAAWRHQIIPNCNFGDIVFTKENYSFENRFAKPFYWDVNRENEHQWDPSELEKKNR